MPSDGPLLARSVERAFSRLARATRRERNRRAAGQHLPAILDRLQQPAPSPSQLLSVMDISVTRGGGVLATLGTTGDLPVALVKMAVSPAHRRNLRRQARILRLVHAQPGLTELSPLVAVPLLVGEESGWGFLIETWLPGRPASDEAGSGATLRNALSTIAVLHRATSCPRTVDEALLRRWVTARVQMVSAVLGAGSGVTLADALGRLESELINRLAGCTVGIGWIHGDYWPGNVRVSDSGSIVGIVDWDSLQSRELPLHDSLHYAVTAMRLAQGQQWGATLRGMLEASATEAEELALAELHATAPGVDRRAALLLYWLRGVESNWRRHPAASERPAWVQANVTPVLQALA